MAIQKCSECGAELRLRPASCPLCGVDTPYTPKERVHIDLDDYQSNVRSLRDELHRIRGEDAQAV
jgi:DNA-directed RNA polymerase subunit RPC12/RpoP